MREQHESVRVRASSMVCVYNKLGNIQYAEQSPSAGTELM